MKSILFLVLLVSASAVPSALVLPAEEVRSREHIWKRANPTGLVYNMTSEEKYGAGNSMRPLIVPGDTMFFQSYVHQPVNGEVVLIDRGANTIPAAHLVIAETEYKVLTKGINNDRNDGWTSKAWIKGVLVGILRKE